MVYLPTFTVDLYGKCRWIYHTWILWVKCCLMYTAYTLYQMSPNHVESMIWWLLKRSCCLKVAMVKLWYFTNLDFPKNFGDFPYFSPPFRGENSCFRSRWNLTLRILSQITARLSSPRSTGGGSERRWEGAIRTTRKGQKCRYNHGTINHWFPLIRPYFLGGG